MIDVPRPIDPLAPTAEGRRRYPPGGFNEGDPCVCKLNCPNPCNGGCGCAACYDRHEEPKE
jgi:hypothetical protein